MPRRRKGKAEQPDEGRNKRIRSFRNRERRQKRKQVADDPLDLTWLLVNGVRMAAAKIMNETYREPAPFWLSMPANPRPGPSSFYPCRSHRIGDRIWYGFLFRAHRDAQALIWPKARKELTPDL